MNKMCRCAFAVVLLLAARAFAGPVFNVVDLGTLGGASSQATGVNASGIVVGSASTMFGATHAFTFSGGGITDLTLASNASNSSVSEGAASAINSAGTVAGTQFVKGQAYATVWSNGAAMSIAGAGSSAMAINDSGQTAGMFTNADGQSHAFLATSDSFADLGPLAGGSWTAAYGINDAGSVAGYGNTASGAFRGFTWSATGGYSELGTLGGWNSYATAINSLGNAAGSAQDSAGWMHAFVTMGTQLIDLGTLGGMSSFGYGMNDEGEVVGASSIRSGDSHAFLVDHGAMIDLNSLIDSSGWILTQAYAINASGQIAGSGMLNGVEHAFRLDYIDGFDDESPGLAQGASSVAGSVATPEPGTFGLVIFGTALVIWSRLRPLLVKARPLAQLLPRHASPPREHPRSRVSRP